MLKDYFEMKKTRLQG